VGDAVIVESDVQREIVVHASFVGERHVAYPQCEGAEVVLEISSGVRPRDVIVFPGIQPYSGTLCPVGNLQVVPRVLHENCDGRTGVVCEESREVVGVAQRQEGDLLQQERADLATPEAPVPTLVVVAGTQPL